MNFDIDLSLNSLSPSLQEAKPNFDPFAQPKFKYNNDPREAVHPTYVPQHERIVTYKLDQDVEDEFRLELDLDPSIFGDFSEVI